EGVGGGAGGGLQQRRGRRGSVEGACSGTGGGLRWRRGRTASVTVQAEGVSGGAGGGRRRQHGRSGPAAARAEVVGNSAYERPRRLPRDDDDYHWPRRCPSPRPLPSQVSAAAGLLPQPSLPDPDGGGREAAAAAATPCNGGVRSRRCLFFCVYMFIVVNLLWI
ncbi:hypothetical protein EE612_027629, partial [Oryza sativa]